MKKMYAFIMLLSMGSVSFMGCGVGRNSNKDVFGGTGIRGKVERTVITAAGVILLSKLLKSLFHTVGKSKAFETVTQNPDFASNFNEDTKLNSFAQNSYMKTALQLLVANHYKIPIEKVANNYSSLSTAGDLATFIGQNADAKVLEGIK